mmetsp:Transcript_21234/g.61805  ORF Transcript_21234/g.61805 Transcript_21234/m.61805 type:complete len:297 (+) Transcript_21234:835-1725(+)
MGRVQIRNVQIFGNTSRHRTKMHSTARGVRGQDDRRRVHGGDERCRQGRTDGERYTDGIGRGELASRVGEYAHGVRGIFSVRLSAPGIVAVAAVVGAGRYEYEYERRGPFRRTPGHVPRPPRTHRDTSRGAFLERRGGGADSNKVRRGYQGIRLLRTGDECRRKDRGVGIRWTDVDIVRCRDEIERCGEGGMHSEHRGGVGIEGSVGGCDVASVPPPSAEGEEISGSRTTTKFRGRNDHPRRRSVHASQGVEGCRSFRRRHDVDSGSIAEHRDETEDTNQRRGGEDENVRIVQFGD